MHEKVQTKYKIKIVKLKNRKGLLENIFFQSEINGCM